MPLFLSIPTHRPALFKGRKASRKPANLPAKYFKFVKLERIVSLVLFFKLMKNFIGQQGFPLAFLHCLGKGPNPRQLLSGY
jgi:hypothetical protein